MTLDELIAGFRDVATASAADAVDKVAGRTGFLPAHFKPRINDKKIVGPAVTVLEGPTEEFVPPQHALDAIDEAEAGSVIVISTNGTTDVALWGGLMTAGAIANKHEAAVLDGGLRDLVEIKRDFDFQVFSRCVSPGTTLGRIKTLAANVEVAMGDVIVRPGDIIMGDVDGLVCIPRDHAEEILIMAREIDQREAEQASLIIASGSLREGLAKYGRI